MNYCCAALFRIFICVLLLAAGREAAEMSGSISSGVYLQQDRIDTTSTPVTLYEGLNLQAKGIGQSDFSLYGGGYATNGFSAMVRHPVELSHLYLDGKLPGSTLSFKLGRHYQFLAIDPMYIDGLSLMASPHKLLNIFFAGGRILPSRETGYFMEPGSSGNLAEAMLRLSSRINRHIRFGLGYQQRFTRKTAFDGITELQASCITGPFSLYSFVDYSLKNEVVQDGRVVLQLHPGDLFSVSLLGAVVDRSVDSSSRIEQLVVRKRTEGGIEFAGGREKGLMVRGSYQVRVFESAYISHSYSLSVTLQRFSYSFNQDISREGWSLRTGPSVRIADWLHADLWSRIMRYGASPFMNYTSNNTLLGVFSLRIMPHPVFRARIDVEGLSNRYYKSDFRVYVKTDLQLSTFREEKRQ